MDRMYTSHLIAAVAIAAGCGGGSGQKITPPDGPPADGPPPDQAPAAPVIDAFAADPSMLPFGGGTVTVSWTVRNATSIELQGRAVTGTSTTLTVAASTTLELRAHGPGGDATAHTDVAVATTITVQGRVIDERGTPLENVQVAILENPTGLTTVTGRDGRFAAPFTNIPPGYTMCLHDPTTCYVGMTRADPTLVLWRGSFANGTRHIVTGTVGRTDAVPMRSTEIAMMLDGPAPRLAGLDPDTDPAPRVPYRADLLLPPGVEQPRGRVWIVSLGVSPLYFGQSADVALVAGGSVTGQDITMELVDSRSLEVTAIGPFPALGLGTEWGLILPRGGRLSIGGINAPPVVPLIPGTQLFGTAAAFQVGTSRRLSTITAVGTSLPGRITLEVPPVPVITSPAAGTPFSFDAELSWTPLPGAVHRIRFQGGGITDLVTTASSSKYPTLPRFWLRSCTAGFCEVSVETYGGLASLDAATDGTALIDVREGRRTGSFSPGPTTRFDP